MQYLDVLLLVNGIILSVLGFFLKKTYSMFDNLRIKYDNLNKYSIRSDERFARNSELLQYQLSVINKNIDILTVDISKIEKLISVLPKN